MKKRSYKLSLPRWALAQRESWYAELAARGLRVQKAGAMLTRFAPAPPARLRYRFEVGSDEGSLPAGQKEFYEECGWQYVLNDRPLHLFCAPEQTDAPDLHTDPAALADSLKTLRGSILSQALGTALWALLMFAQLTYLGRYTLELVLADAAAPLVWAILAVTLFRLGWGVYSMLALMRTRQAKQEDGAKISLKKIFPFFVLFFVLAAVITTVCQLPANVTGPLKDLSKFLIIMAMAAVGMNTNIVQLVKTGGKPILTGFCCWVAIAAVSLGMQTVLGIW